MVFLDCCRKRLLDQIYAFGGYMKPGIATVALILTDLAFAQSPKVVRLEILVNNMVSYKVDVADPLAMAQQPAPVPAADPLHTFEEFIGIGDIVSINGKPASG